MFHRNLADVCGDSINQAVRVRIWTAILDDFVNHETIHHLETGKIKVFRLVEHEGRDPIVEPAAEISEPGMFLLDVMSVNDIEFLSLQFVQHPNDFFRRLLTVVVHYRDITASRRGKAGQDGAVLAKNPAQMHEHDCLRKFLHELSANLLAVVLGTIVNQNNFKRCRSKNFDDVLHQTGHGATSVVNGDHQG